MVWVQSGPQKTENSAPRTTEGGHTGLPKGRASLEMGGCCPGGALKGVPPGLIRTCPPRGLPLPTGTPPTSSPSSPPSLSLPTQCGAHAQHALCQGSRGPASFTPANTRLVTHAHGPPPQALCRLRNGVRLFVSQSKSGRGLLEEASPRPQGSRCSPETGFSGTPCSFPLAKQRGVGAPFQEQPSVQQPGFSHSSCTVSRYRRGTESKCHGAPFLHSSLAAAPQSTVRQRAASWLSIPRSSLSVPKPFGGLTSKSRVKAQRGSLQSVFTAPSSWESFPKGLCVVAALRAREVAPGMELRQGRGAAERSGAPKIHPAASKICSTRLEGPHKGKKKRE